MGRLIVWVTLASLVLMMVAAAALTWRRARGLAGWRRAALAGLVGLLMALPGAGFVTAVLCLVRWMRAQYPGATAGYSPATAAEIVDHATATRRALFDLPVYDAELPSCAR